MHISINKGSDVAMIDSESLIDLFEAKIKVLDIEKPEGYQDSIIEFQDAIIALSYQLLQSTKTELNLYNK